MANGGRLKGESKDSGASPQQVGTEDPFTILPIRLDFALHLSSLTGDGG